MHRITAIILAGGQSSRMGFDKAFLKINHKPLIIGIIDKFKGIFGQIIIVVGRKENFGYSSASVNISMLNDLVPDKGPLGGIYTGLLNSKTKYNFVVACDMPFLNIALVRYLIAHKGNYDIIIPRINKKFHPLFGVYSKACISVIGERLKQGNLRIAGIFPKLKTHFVTKKEIERIDRGLQSLMNINTPDDFKSAKEAALCPKHTQR